MWMSGLDAETPIEWARDRGTGSEKESTTRHPDVDVWGGLDVGKENHYPCALDADGKRLFDKALHRTRTGSATCSPSCRSTGGCCWSLTKPNTIGALPVAVARDRPVAYLPGSAMHKAAQHLPGGAKTDATDAYVIATTTLRVPDTLRAVDRGGDKRLKNVLFQSAPHTKSPRRETTTPAV